MKITHWRNPETGLIEGIDETGAVVSIQRNPNLHLDVTTREGFTLQDTKDGRRIWVEDGLVDVKASGWNYTPALGGAIATLVASGASLTKIQKTDSSMPPYAVIARWISVIPEFKVMIDQALKDRAHLRAEEVLEIADETYREVKGTEDQVQGAKLAIDARKYTAEKDHADKYGSKAKQVGDVAVQIVIDTGIHREPLDVTPKAAEIEASSGS